jgi:imidazolonepropionase-like amidohydrolase
MNLSRVASTVAIALLMSLGGPRNVARSADPPVTVIRDVTVISAERAAPLEHAYVRLANGRIADVSTYALTGDLAIDGRGRFLIPGLIDSHTHLRSTPGMQAPQRAVHPDLVAQADAQEPRSYLYFGFTTVLSLGDTAGPIQRWNTLDVRPDAYFCGGTPILNGYSFRGAAESPYFLFNPDQADTLPSSVDRAAHTPKAVVERMARDGAICVKAYREAGFGQQAGRLPVPSVDMIRALVAAAHARNMPVFLHANSIAAQEFAVQAGVDVIAHGMWNGHRSAPDRLDAGVEPILEAVLTQRMGYQPTAQVIRGLGDELDDAFFADPLLARVYPPRLIEWFRSPEGDWFRRQELNGTTLADYERISGFGDAVTRYLAKNNARFLFGTDTPSAPIYTNPPGLNGLFEMRRWAGAGVSARQLFRAATIDNAKIMRLDRSLGTVEKGKRANLLLLRANPLEDVEAYNTIESVFLAGRLLPRGGLAAGR